MTCRKKYWRLGRTCGGWPHQFFEGHYSCYPCNGWSKAPRPANSCPRTGDGPTISLTRDVFATSLKWSSPQGAWGNPSRNAHYDFGCPLAIWYFTATKYAAFQSDRSLRRWIQAGFRWSIAIGSKPGVPAPIGHGRQLNENWCRTSRAGTMSSWIRLAMTHQQTEAERKEFRVVQAERLSRNWSVPEAFPGVLAQGQALDRLCVLSWTCRLGQSPTGPVVLHKCGLQHTFCYTRAFCACLTFGPVLEARLVPIRIRHEGAIMDTSSVILLLIIDSPAEPACPTRSTARSQNKTAFATTNLVSLPSPFPQPKTQPVMD